MEKFLEVDVVEKVAFVRLNRPEMHNAFHEALISQLTQTFLEQGENQEVRVIVLCSTGKSFCAGADLNWMKKMVDYSFDENLEDAKRLAEMFRAIAECPKPVVARVQGGAFGGGVGLVACCDVAVGLASATFALSEVKLGILPATILPYLLERVGMAPLRRYALTAEPFNAEEAKRIGLLNEVAQSESELDEKISAICSALKKNSPSALLACKKLLREIAGKTPAEVRELTSLRIAEIRVSPEGQEGLRAFLEKRKPNWDTHESKSN
jgi:methylglutaconyl-CoA hydratase